MAGKPRPQAGPLRHGETGTDPKRDLFTMDAAEVEFLAEKELVTIIPNFSLDKIYLIGVRRAGRGCGRGVMDDRPPLLSTWGSALSLQGDLGPFNPGLPVEVPLWLAINLKQRQKCRLLPPEWMDVGELPWGPGGSGLYLDLPPFSAPGSPTAGISWCSSGSLMCRVCDTSSSCLDFRYLPSLKIKEMWGRRDGPMGKGTCSKA